MITAISIKNLRGIRQGELKDLAPLTILVGPNNSGKSTVLDAIMIAASPELGKGHQFARDRRKGLVRPMDWLTWRQGPKLAGGGEITAWEDAKSARRIVFDGHKINQLVAVNVQRLGESHVEMRPMPSEPLKTVPQVRFVDPFGAGPHEELHDLLTRATRNGLDKKVTALVGDLVPNVRDIRILVTENKPVVELVSDAGSMPEATAGEGVRMLLRLALELAAPAGGIVLIEEPEMHMHPAAIRLVAKAMLAAMERGIQVIVSTHSLDLIDFVLGLAAPEKLDELAVFRLVLEDGELKSTRYSGKEAEFARNTVEEDLR